MSPFSSDLSETEALSKGSLTKEHAETPRS